MDSSMNHITPPAGNRRPSISNATIDPIYEDHLMHFAHQQPRKFSASHIPTHMVPNLSIFAQNTPTVYSDHGTFSTAEISYVQSPAPFVLSTPSTGTHVQQPSPVVHRPRHARKPSRHIMAQLGPEATPHYSLHERKESTDESVLWPQRDVSTIDTNTVESDDEYNSDQDIHFGMLGERQRPLRHQCFPNRWFSLRNVIAVSNVTINVVAIIVISLVSYFASYDATQSAVDAMANLTVSDIALKLDNSLSFAEQSNVYTEDSLRLHNVQLNETAKAIPHFLFVFSQLATHDIDQIYAVSPENFYTGAGRPRPIGNNTTNKIQMVIKFINATTQPQRLQMTINEPCTVQNMFCTQNVTMVLWINVTYYGPSRPYYKKAVAIQRTGWSDIYPFATDNALGLTAVRPVYRNANKTDLMAVAAVDITLSSLSMFLDSAAKAIDNSGDERLILFILERTTGLLVASSQPDAVPLQTATNSRIRAIDSQHWVVRSTASQLASSAAYWNAANAVLTSGADLIVTRSYRDFSQDIDWIIILNVPSEIFQDQLNRAYLVNIPLVTAVVLVASILVSVVVTRIIGRPLKRISEQMIRVANLNFDETSKSSGIEYWNLKEIKNIERAMSSMTMGLKSFARYVPLDVVTLLVKVKREAVLGVDEMDITILFTDIADFTSIAERMHPRDLVHLMGEYFKEMSQIILESQGIVDKYIGDSVMAFWNAPIAMENHALVGCAVALNCQKRTMELQSRWLKLGYPLIKTRIGINTGLALVGNFGAPDRFDYTCIGDTVNLASRLEGLNKTYHTEIIISEQTYSRIHNHFVCRPLDRVQVKGKTVAVTVYELIDFKQSAPATLLQDVTLYLRAYESYQRKDFAMALSDFETYLMRHPDDYPSIRLTEKCQQALMVPQSSYDTVVVLHEK